MVTQELSLLHGKLRLCFFNQVQLLYTIHLGNQNSQGPVETNGNYFLTGRIEQTHSLEVWQNGDVLV